MRDRQVFETTKLTNGITIYSYPMEVEFVIARLVVPVGHVHNTGNILPGSAHMLEHMLMNRSKLHPELNQYKSLLGINGGASNAGTSNYFTSYDFDCPSIEFLNMWPGFLARPLDPLLKEEDLENERTVISNERNRKRWWPGNSELSHYLLTEWKSYTLPTLEQRLGSDEDLSKMTIENLSSLQKKYYDPRTYLIIGGMFDMDLVKKSLENIPVEKHSLAVKNAPTVWKNKEFQEKSFRDVNNFTYILSALFDDPLDFKTISAVRFIFRLLTNTVQEGNLLYWLREEKGWVYTISQSVSRSDTEWQWNLYIALDKKEHVDIVKKELHGRIIKIISDQNMIDREIERGKKGNVFNYQTLGRIVNGGMNDLYDYGKIYSEKEWYDTLDACKDTAYLKSLYDTYIAPPNACEFLAMPEKKD